MKIAMIIPFDPSTRGGVLRAVKSQEVVYRYLGAEVETFYASELDRTDLKGYDIIHVHGPLKVGGLLKIRKSGVPAVLTVHGWVINEALTALRMDPIGNLHYILRLINWALHMLIFIRIVYRGRITTVSEIKRKMNHLDAMVIHNALITHEIDKKVSKCQEIGKNCLTAVTYVSIGGSMVSSIPRLVEIVEKVNRKTSKRLRLLVFGDDRGYDTDNVKFMGYRDDFLCYLKSADIMLLGYEMSELGYAILEAGYLGVPIAKFRGEYEELEDGVHGIIADDEDYMVQRLREFIEDPSIGSAWGENLKDYILKTRSVDVIGKRWKLLIEELRQSYQGN
ncbi:glycosyltransferase [Methanothermobacter sp.]|uniref:glycosyltransferase n=1 Tax=Methanothermobacter sp. TaxID=1884223 RepID=UPI0026339724|nr:glycosyltransferase [Methanothermobacter sp.]MDI9617646.1 glycosyltransferase [Methanothermobacter sp.]